MSKPDPSLDINDIVKACTPGAEQNNNYAQYVLALAYYRQKITTMPISGPTSPVKTAINMPER